MRDGACYARPSIRPVQLAAMPNRLLDSLSPYLQQHAHNPVDWYPWAPEALQAARTSDRPILLSVGYSACHWCHVMAHECFENEAIAERMNAWFVNIKVDREERPDLDRIYQLSHQILSGRGGGWPLTVFLDPSDLMPFVAGTYFPPEARHGLIGFGELLERVHAAWLDRRDTLRAQNEQLQQALGMISARQTEAEPGATDPQDTLLGQLDSRRDRRHGGFGDAPKFPQAPLMTWLMRAAEHDDGAAGMLDDALRAMAENGLFDHLVGGFFRYCTDAAWEIPHFEKMLYDNALLLPLYAEASVRWRRDDYRRTAQLTAEFLARDLRLDQGGLASSLDADSPPPEPAPGEPATPREGAHYLWTPAQFDGCLDAQRSSLAHARYGLDGPPNFEGSAWHLVIARSLDELARSASDHESLREEMEAIRRQLLACRRRRPAPGRDDKLVAGWNAHAAAGLMRAGRLLDQMEWCNLGAETVDRVWERLFAEPPARAVWRDGRSAQPALLDDHAALLLAGLERLATRWDSEWLARVDTLAEAILDRFFDTATDTLYLTPHDHERLILRPTANVDESLPAGAAVAALGLLRLGHLTANAEWLDLARRIVDAAMGDVQRAPGAHAAMLTAARELRSPTPQVLIGGPPGEADRWHARLGQRPELHGYRVSPGAMLTGPLGRVAGAEQPVALVCAGMRCLEPASSLDDALARLRDARDHGGDA